MKLSRFPTSEYFTSWDLTSDWILEQTYHSIHVKNELGWRGSRTNISSSRQFPLSKSVFEERKDFSLKFMILEIEKQLHNCLISWKLRTLAFSRSVLSVLSWQTAEQAQQLSWFGEFFNVSRFHSGSRRNQRNGKRRTTTSEIECRMPRSIFSIFCWSLQQATPSKKVRRWKRSKAWGRFLLASVEAKPPIVLPENQSTSVFPDLVLKSNP